MADLTATGTQGAGLGTRGARYTLVLVWALGIWSTVMQNALDQYLPQLILASILQLASALLLTLPGGRRLPLPLGLMCAGAAVLAGLTVLFAAASTPDLWPFNFATYLLALLTTRGNASEGVGGGIALIAAALMVGMARGTPASDLLAFLALPLVAFVIGIVWRIALGIAVDRERTHLTAAELARLAAEAAEAATAQDQAMIDEVRAEAGPALDAIRLGRRIGDREALQLAVLEEGIRDRIRSPRLRHPLLDATVRDARERGIRVLLLGSESTEASTLEAPLAGAIAETIAAVAEGSVTVRALPRDRGAAVSLLVVENGSTRRIALDADGRLEQR